MRSAFFILLFIARTGLAQPPENTVRLAQALATETIPRLQLKDATFDEALAAIRRAWEERHPNDPFPVGLTDYQLPEGPRETYPARITCDLKSIPFLEALRYLGMLSGRRFVSVNGLVQLERHSWIEEDWVTRVHDVSPQALAALHLKPDSSSADLRRALQQFGVKFEDWMKLSLTDSGQQLVMLSYESQQEQIAGILFLLANGFRITR